MLVLFKKITYHFKNLSRTVHGKNDNLDRVVPLCTGLMYLKQQHNKRRQAAFGPMSR
jgi:hypothetical protein